MSSVTVAVTGFAGLDNPEPGTPVARALRLGWKGPLRIEALGYDKWMGGAWVPGLADCLHVMPPVRHGLAATSARLLEIHRQRPLDAIIPCLDLEVPVIAQLSDSLEREAGIKTLVPKPEAIHAVGKIMLPTLCHQHDIAVPRTVHVLNPADAPAAADQLGYPVMVKGTVAGAVRAENAGQVAREAARLYAKWGGGVLLQKVIKGEEYVVAAVVRADGSCLSAVPMRKLCINHRGKAAIGAVVNDPDLIREARRILRHLNWRGPLELEFMRASNTGKLHLIEVNCRFPSWILLSHFAGCNLPALLLQEMLAPRRARARVPRPGAAFVRDIQEMVVPEGQLQDLERLKSVKGPRCTTNPPGRRWRNNRADRDGMIVGITGISASDVVMPGLGTAWALRQAPGVSRIYGLAYGAYDTGLYRTDLFDGTFRIPEPSNADAFCQSLVEVKRQYGLDMLVPSLDIEMPIVAAQGGRLAAAGIATLVPSVAALERVRKENLTPSKIDRDPAGFDVLPVMKIWTLQGVERAARAFGFPMVLKGLVATATTVYSIEEARTAWLALREHGHERVLAQPYVYGDEYAVATVCDRRHDATGAAVIKKLLRCEQGKTWGAVSVDEPRLAEAVSRLLKTLRWVGPIEAEFIRDWTTDRYVLIELNPRWPAWIRYAAEIGVNLPYAAVCCALDRPLPRLAPKPGMVFLRSCEEVATKVSAIAAFATQGGWHHEAA